MTKFLYISLKRNIRHNKILELFQLVDDNEQPNPFAKVIKKAMQYSQQRGPVGYFTKGDFEYTLLMRPNAGWNIDKVEQTFNALLENGKIKRSYHDNEDLLSNSN
jgi:hypothetical protein